MTEITLTVIAAILGGLVFVFCVFSAVVLTAPYFDRYTRWLESISKRWGA